MKRQVKLIAVLLAAVLLVTAGTVVGCVVQQDGSGGSKPAIGGGKRQVMMTINGRKVYPDEVLSSFVMRQALRTFINVQVLKQKAVEKNIKIDPEEVKKKIEQQKEDMRKMGQDWDAFLESQGISEKDVAEQFEMNLLFESVLNSMVEVTEDQLKQTWERNKEQIITQYLTENKLPDTEKANVTYEKCKDIVEKMTKRESAGGKQMDLFNQLTMDTTLSCDSISDSALRKATEDALINNMKKQIEDEKKKAEEAKNAPPAGAPSAGGAPPAAPPAEGAASKAPEGEKKEESKNAPPKPNPGK